MGVDDQGYHPKCTTHRFKQGSLSETPTKTRHYSVKGKSLNQTVALFDSPNTSNCLIVSGPPTLKDIQTCSKSLNDLHKTK